MPYPSRHCLRLAVKLCSALMFSFLAAGQTHAQNAEEVFKAYFDNWFQVEIIIFERIEKPSPDPEVWPKNPSLAYPAKLTFFRDEVVQDSADAEANPEDNQAFLALLKKGRADDAFSKKLISSLSEAELARLTPKEKPYVKLGAASQQLQNDAKLIARDRASRVLFHEAWRQPFHDEKEAYSLVITGGDLYDKHYELEGTIHLYVSRYLHIQTNLWLTQFDANTGQNMEHWPWLPSRPEASATTITPENENSSSASDNTSEMSSGIDTNLPSLEFGFQAGSELTFSNQASKPLFDDFASVAAQPYIIRQLVLMQQKRRMRSTELHYIDHPRLGILIRIDPYAPKFADKNAR